LLLNSSLVRAVRIAFGIALFAAAIMVLGSSGAFAASDADPSNSSQNAPTKGVGLLSGILNPVASEVDKVVAHVPAVKQIAGNTTVGTVLTPVTTGTDAVEASVAAVPVVGSVVAPVGAAATAMVPSVVSLVAPVTTPVLAAVDQVVAPVTQITAPIVQPVAEVVRPIVEGVTGASGTGVDQVLSPRPGVAETVPGTPNLPAVPGTSDVGVTGSGSAAGGVHNDPTAVLGVGRVLGAGPVAPSVTHFLAAGLFPGNTSALDVPTSAEAWPDGEAPRAACSSSAAATAVGPCAPAVESAAGPGTSGANSGGSGGASGTAAANENFSTRLSFAAGSAAMSNGDWPLPASMPADPGSSPD
jgi:hypothetical protein